MEKLSFLEVDFPDPNDSKIKIASYKSIRGIIFDKSDSKLLLIKSNKFGEYSFPGGGQESGETNEMTLIREINEETGYRIEEIRDLALITEEFRTSFLPEYDYFHMISYFYVSTVYMDKFDEVNLTKMEQEYQIVPVWVSPNYAFQKNKTLMKPGANRNFPWIIRETSVLNYLIKNQNENYLTNL